MMMMELKDTTDRIKRTRRVKKSATGSSKTATSKKAAVPAAPAVVAAGSAVAEAQVAESSRRPASPVQARAHKQQKLSDGEAALVRRCLSLGAEANWSISPPLSRVQERHVAYAMHAKAMRSRGPSALQSASEHLPGSEGSLVECLIKGVANVELAEMAA